MKEFGPHAEIEIDEEAFKALRELPNQVKSMNANLGILNNDKLKGAEGYGLAQIGAVHEFGGWPRVTAKMWVWFYHNFGVKLSKSKQYLRIPPRPFLRSTMHQKAESGDFQKFIDSNQWSFADSILKGRLVDVLREVAGAWVGYVHEAFDTQGWGAWRALSPLTLMKREGNTPLVASGALKRSIKMEIVEK